MRKSGRTPRPNKKLLGETGRQKYAKVIAAIQRCRYEVEQECLLNPDIRNPDMAVIYSDLNLALQTAWQFNRDVTMHRFWDLPGCSCPRMDNEDRRGTRYAVVNPDCPYHGSNAKQERDRIYFGDADGAKFPAARGDYE